MATVTLDGGPLAIADVLAVAREGAAVEIGAEAHRRLLLARSQVEAVLASGRAVYGINTGFGSLSRVRIPTEDLATLQRNLILSTAAGVGDPLPDEVVRAMLLLLVASLCRGHSGVRPAVAELLVGLLNGGVTPMVPASGSVGASGDLAPLAHLGWCYRRGRGDFRRASGCRAAWRWSAPGCGPSCWPPRKGWR